MIPFLAIFFWIFRRRRRRRKKFKREYRRGDKKFNDGHIVYRYEEDECVSLTHSDKHDNIKLKRNPNPKDKTSSYIHPCRYRVEEKHLREGRKRGFRKPTRRDKKMIKHLPKTDKTPNEIYKQKKKPPHIAR